MLSLEPNNLDDCLERYPPRRRSAWVRPGRGAVIIVRQRLAAIHKETHALSRATSPRSNVLAVKAGGNWMPELRSGRRPRFVRHAGEHSNWLDWATLIEADHGSHCSRALRIQSRQPFAP